MIEKEKVARPEGLEPPTLCLEGRRSIRLSYGRMIAFILEYLSNKLKPENWGPMLRAL
jgi:hypothetical protein